ncbi:MAG: adenylosuccinate lyase [Caldithrix sp.]|nr:adenylosuccinate lyase [Caldithrix sp.]
MENAISPLDGRYASKLSHFGAYFSEYALMRWRVIIELRFVKALNETGLFRALSAEELKCTDALENNFDAHHYQQIKTIEERINHDVKAVEEFLRQNLNLKQKNMIHFGLTSEDVNNLAYTGMLQAYVHEQQIPRLKAFMEELMNKTGGWCDQPFPARTHGQVASPSTGGKEMAVFLSRLLVQYQALQTLRFKGKLNGATGNYSALTAAFPHFDWIAFSNRFIESLNMETNPVTTQIEDHDAWSAYFAVCRRINNILLDFDRDIWFYLTLGYLTLSTDTQSVGSSTMPHKVNPINFENSEGNLQVANGLLSTLMDKFGTSRLQRDLSDSTVERNIGVALAHGDLALQESMKGLKRLQINTARCDAELDQFPELLAEPIQTILRREGVDDPYMLLKELTRGKRIDRQGLHQFIDNLQLPDKVKEELKALNVRTYIGKAPEICKQTVNRAQQILNTT